MQLHELVRAVLAGDLITARQLVADAQRMKTNWDRLAQPRGLSARELTVAAALTELLAVRAGERPPLWTAAVGPSRDTIVLDPGLEQMPRSFARAKISGPEALRRRNLIALPDFLSVA
jgi:hypothetical protein